MIGCEGYSQKSCPAFNYNYYFKYITHARVEIFSFHPLACEINTMVSKQMQSLGWGGIGVGFLVDPTCMHNTV